MVVGILTILATFGFIQVFDGAESLDSVQAYVTTVQIGLYEKKFSLTF